MYYNALFPHYNKTVLALNFFVDRNPLNNIHLTSFNLEYFYQNSWQPDVGCFRRGKFNQLFNGFNGFLK